MARVNHASSKRARGGYPSYENVPTQGKRKTLARVGIDTYDLLITSLLFRAWVTGSLRNDDGDGIKDVTPNTSSRYL